MAFAQGFARFWGRAFSTTLILSGLAAFSPAWAQDEAEHPDPEDVTVGQLARHYRVYQRDMDALEDVSFTSVTDLRAANDLILSYEPPELTRGWYAHNALVAARSPGFMATMRERARRSGGSETFLAEAGQNPSYLWNISSQTAAINRVLNGVWSDTREATAVGRILNERAYAYMDRRYGSRLPDDAAETAVELIEADRAAVAASDGRIYVPYRAQNVMQQVLQIAARLSVDPSGRRTNASGLIYPQEETNRCLRWAQLNLAQCLAATRSPAEEAYCTGRHGVDDVAECWGWMVDTSSELEVTSAE